MIYVFHGSDEYGIAEAVKRLRQLLSEADPMADLNYSELDGRRLAVPELRLTADAMPFMGERRLVVVRGLLARCNPQGGDKSGRQGLVEALKAWLPALAPTTRLVFWEGRLEGNNPLLQWAEKQRTTGAPAEQSLVVKKFEAPKAAEMPRWLTARASAKGGAIAPRAADALADALARDGSVDARLADSELEKLLTYAGPRPVEEQDVALLVTPVSLESIFKLMDALSDRNGPVATTLLHQFLANNEQPLRILALMVRQVRLLLQTRGLMDAGITGQALEARLPVAPFIARKLGGQARRFSTPFLEAALRRLLEIDTEIKTGRIQPTLALDLFVAGVCAGGGSAGSLRR